MEDEKDMSINADKTTNLSSELLAMLKRAEGMIESAKGEELQHMVGWAFSLTFAVNSAYSTESDYLRATKTSFDQKEKDAFDLKKLELEKELDFKRTEMEKDKDFEQAKMESGKATKERKTKKMKEKEEKEENDRGKNKKINS